ncbi:hypothetical protein SAMN05444278_10254 [Psychroflexus salarius]|uniref:Peptidase E n=1 Tax=Psychroflexus salarius TaxID=1155689 RepID=A0A1M4TW42_9FLAO|nr:DUF6702 family protein [Psychroflexus salarius]SHE48709.1 hypothetical protein SAMN05444278_10254 [Psychroflexus salarius]
MNINLAFILSFLMSFSASKHEYYLSVTDVDYIEDQNSIQIISRVFVDDFENVLKKRYQKPFVLIEGNEIEETETYIERYINQKFSVEVDGKSTKLNYLGFKYKDDMVFLFIEINDIKPFSKITIKDEILIDLFKTQKNLIHFTAQNFRQSFILEKDLETKTLHLN